MTHAPVSIHGGHSGRFCTHAQDDLEALIRAYLRKGFAWVGVTEHMPPADDHLLYPEERTAGFNAAKMRARFADYFTEARRLQRAYADRLEIFVGFETEAGTGCFDLAQTLANEHGSDYLVGGVHFVDDIPIDYDEKNYGHAVHLAGSIDNLYCRYFDLQYHMIQRLKPAVVAHFDLIRIYDRDYRTRLAVPGVQERITRNLELIARHDLILDFNVSALRKGAAEPYLARKILKQAMAMGISVVPADDAHSVDTVGACLDEGIAILEALGVMPPWRKPVSPHQLFT